MRSLPVAAVLVGLFAVAPAHADWDPVGSVGASVHIELSSPGERGGTLLVDLWEPFGLFRLGLAAGVGALASGNEDANRAFAPIGLSLGIAGRGDLLGGSLILRGGPWGGATKEGLRGGAWCTVGASLDIPWGDRLLVALTADLWVIGGASELRTLIAPGIALRWEWPPEEPYEP